jgi:hypothetical protein
VQALALRVVAECRGGCCVHVHATAWAGRARAVEVEVQL